MKNLKEECLHLLQTISAEKSNITSEILRYKSDVIRMESTVKKGEVMFGIMNRASSVSNEFKNTMKLIDEAKRKMNESEQCVKWFSEKSMEASKIAIEAEDGWFEKFSLLTMQIMMGYPSNFRELEELCKDERN